MRDQPDTTGLIEVAIEPPSGGDLPRLVAALETLAAQDRTFGFSTDAETGQTIVRGLSEPHLDVAIDTLNRLCGFRVTIGAPQVAYRETLTKAVEVDCTHAKQMGGAGQFARVKIRFEPLPRGSGFVFENAAGGGAVPADYVTGVEKGLNASRASGLVAGFPVIDFKATLVDGAYHEIDSNALTFEIATRAAFRQLKDRKAVKLLEPVMRVEVTTPDDFIGSVIGDLHARRGQIESTGELGDAQIVTALVPLASLFGYGNALMGMCRGKAAFTMRFERYDDLPRSRGNDDDDPGRFPPAAAMRA